PAPALRIAGASPGLASMSSVDVQPTRNGNCRSPAALILPASVAVRVQKSIPTWNRPPTADLQRRGRTLFLLPILPVLYRDLPGLLEGSIACRLSIQNLSQLRPATPARCSRESESPFLPVRKPIAAAEFHPRHSSLPSC